MAHTETDVRLINTGIAVDMLLGLTLMLDHGIPGYGIAIIVTIIIAASIGIGVGIGRNL